MKRRSKDRLLLQALSTHRNFKKLCINLLGNVSATRSSTLLLPCAGEPCFKRSIHRAPRRQTVCWLRLLPLWGAGAARALPIRPNLRSVAGFLLSVLPWVVVRVRCVCVRVVRFFTLVSKGEWVRRLEVEKSVGDLCLCCLLFIPLLCSEAVVDTWMKVSIEF